MLVCRLREHRQAAERGSVCGMMAPAAAAALLTLLSATASAQSPAETYNFLAVGDWGDDSAGQHAAAAGMGLVAKQINATQVFALGDNFYHSAESHCSASGICPNDKETGHNPDGPDGMVRFKSTFEDVYTAPSLRNIPFWAVAGNHDHGGNVSAQIAYSQNAQNLPCSASPGGAGGSRRWRFPNWYYNVTEHFVIGGKPVELEVLLFDSVVMVGNTDTYHADGTVTEAPLSEMVQQTDPAAAEQLKWLTQRMEASTADYLWVGGHYPVWAIGQDGPTPVREILRGLLNKWEAHYFNGHQHDLEHIVEDGLKVNYVSTGAGKQCCYEDKNLDTVPANSIKFAMSGPGGEQWWGRNPPAFEVLSGFTSCVIIAYP